MDRLLLAFFLVFLALPSAISTLSDAQPDALTQAGRRARQFPRPTVSAVLSGAFNADFDDWFADALGGRTALLRARNRLIWFGLGMSPADEIVRGADDWLFTRRRGSIQSFRGIAPLTAAQLQELRRYVEQRAAWLAERGSELVLVVAPNKSSIYPNRMPERFTRHGPTPLDQFLEHMHLHSSFELHDYRNVLIDETAADRPGDYVYHPLGTHWTDRGARAATRALVREAVRKLRPRFQGLNTLSAAHYDVHESERPGDSLAVRLLLDDVLVQDVWDHTVRAPRALLLADDTHVVRTGLPDQIPGVRQLPDVLVVHDSFGLALRPHLAELFRRSTFVNSRRIDDAIVEDAQPDVVVMVIVERNLAGLPQVWPLHGHSRAERTLHD